MSVTPATGEESAGLIGRIIQQGKQMP